LFDCIYEEGSVPFDISCGIYTFVSVSTLQLFRDRRHEGQLGSGLWLVSSTEDMLKNTSTIEALRVLGWFRKIKL